MYKYETPSIWIASALFSQGHSCKAEKIGKLKNDKSKFLFIFEVENEDQEKQLKIKVDKINRNEMNVNLDTFTKSYQTLKNLIFD